MRLILNVDCRCPEKRCPVHLETEVKNTDTNTDTEVSKKLHVPLRTPTPPGPAAQVELLKRIVKSTYVFIFNELQDLFSII